MSIRINSTLNLPAASAVYAAKGHVSLSEFLLSTDAEHLLQTAKNWQLWNLVTLIKQQHQEFDATDMAQIDAAKWKVFETLVHAEACAGFGYLFDTVPIYDLGMHEKLNDPHLRSIFEFIRSDTFLDIGRRVTGDPRIRFADCQLTRYRAGHFLTKHDDGVAGKNRVAAYVLSLNKNWRADFGGILQLMTHEDNIHTGLTPSFNCLNIFKVPQSHSVSLIAPFVKDARYSITGWFRHGDEPIL